MQKAKSVYIYLCILCLYGLLKTARHRTGLKGTWGREELRLNY